jgi:putative ABC transport system permease protein
MQTLLRDLRYALRQLSKNPGFTVIAVTALALGIGLSTTIFSVFYNGVLYPFPYRDAKRLTVIRVLDPTRAAQNFRDVFHLDEVAAFRQGNHTFDDVVAYSGWDVAYQQKTSSVPIHGCVLTPNAMGFWGVRPLLGRGLEERDAKPGAGPVALLGYAYWKSMFHGDKAVLGTTMILAGQAHTIIGVMPPRFVLFGADLYVPIAWNRPEPSFADAMNSSDPMYFFATGLIKPNVTLQTAAADLQGIAKNLVPLHRQDFPEHFQMGAKPMNEVIVDDFKQTLTYLIAAVLLLLLISSSNVASLLLTQHTARAREISLRAALGATRSRLVRQLFVESLVLGLAGCMAGCLLAWLGLTIVTLVPGLQVPGEADMSLNWPVLLFAVTLSLLVTLLFGLAPALVSVRKDLRSNLQTTGVNVSASRGGARIRSGLVIVQVALSMLLLVFASLMMRSFFAITHSDSGIRTEGLWGGEIHFPAHQYDTAEKKRLFFDRALTRVSALPGVSHAAVSIWLPLEGSPTSEDITIPGKPHQKHWTTAFEAVSEEYFPTVGLQLLRGRLLSASDVASASHVAVVNRTLVKSYFGTEDPIGKQIKLNELDQLPNVPHDVYYQIVGVVSDYRNSGMNEPVLPQVLIPYTFAGFGDRAILVRTSVNPSLLVNDIRQALADTDPSILLLHTGTVDEYLQTHVYMKPKFRLISFGICAGIGLGLALIGLFGIMAYSVTLQTHEFGVRIALGAQANNILQLVLGKGLLLVGSGILLGLVASLLSVRILRSQLWGVSAFDRGAFILAPLALLATGLLACYIPARRAMRVDPMVALRHD